MEPTADDLAGVVALFGGLTREEIRAAIEHLAARRGSEFDPEDVDARIDDAVASYALVRIEDGETLFAPGPTAFPTLPDHGEDLPHMLDAPERDVDDGELADVVEAELRREAATAVDDGDRDRIAALLDFCYEVEAWGDVDLSRTRERLDAALET